MEFVGPAWAPWTAEDKEVIERVQKAAVKMISGLERKTYEERCREIGLDSMERRKEDADMIQTFKIIAGEDKVERGTWFQLTAQNSQRTTRATEDRTPLAGKRIRTEARTVKVSKGNYEHTERKSRPRNEKNEMDKDERSTRKLPDNST